MSLMEKADVFDISFIHHLSDAVIFLSHHQNIYSFNPAAEMLSGYLAKEMEGQSITSILPDLVIEDERQIETKEWLHTKDGRMVPVIVTIQSIRHQPESLYCLIVKTASSGSVRKEEDQNYQFLFEYSPNTVFAISLDGKIKDVNKSAEEYTGYSRDMLIHQSFEMLFDDQESKRAASELKKVTNGKLRNWETYIYDKDGKRKEIGMTAIPVIMDQRVYGVYAIACDMTEVKSTEEMLKKSDTLSIVGQLAASVVHEIRNPLTALKGFIQLLQTRETVNAQKYYQIMFDELNRIEKIVTELLILAKPQVKDYEKKSIEDLLDYVVALLKREAENHNSEIEFQSTGEMPLVECDEDGLKQVFINVVKNALESMEKGGVVRVSCSSDDKDVMIAIEDEGCGIPEEDIKKIGKPFYTTKDKGTGLGLMISQQIIKKHKGTFQIKSKKGKGTTVQITLPVA